MNYLLKTDKRLYKDIIFVINSFYPNDNLYVYYDKKVNYQHILNV